MQKVLFVILVILIGTGAYFLGKNQSLNIKQNESAFPSSTPFQSNLKIYNGQYITFQYPNSWSPAPLPVPGQGAVLESLSLGIPGVISDQDLGFSSVPFQTIKKPTDITQETPITIAGQPAFKRIRKGSNYVSYDYVTNGHYSSAGSFSIHVTVASEDKNLESQLDKVAQSIIFK